ncbi:hypothetical protein [Bordetella sp. N]|uniref:hypothetical protein n=1 Tax=Bordetella sp. N TaxID=1746199 RepID=UPI00070F1749|nr:hypothetical protein [Bordetella sp. N]ALM85822.1 hypothetical protein ASB57_25295 [Bordetella sp. N]
MSSIDSLEAQVKAALLERLPAVLQSIPRDEALYCLLLCYTNEDTGAAWPPFLVWGKTSYRDQIVATGESVSYYLWAPDEIREVQGYDDEYWFDDESLVELCARHADLIDVGNSQEPVLRVLAGLVPEVRRLVQAAGLPVTDDFVVAYADNTGAVDTVGAMEAVVDSSLWAVLKQRGYV